MKEITVQEAQGKLSQLMAEARRGGLIVLTDGDTKMKLSPAGQLDFDEENPELEAELLKAANGPFHPWREGELREIADKALKEHRARRKG